MNYHESGVFPFSWNPKHITEQWSGFDKPETLSKHPQKDFWSTIDISYKYSPQGFRTHDFNQYLNQTVDIALGCSFTEGIAMPLEHVWTSIIEQHTQIPMLNLGLGGGSTDTVARVLTNIAPLFKINTVYILWPKIERFEQYYENKIEPVLPMRCEQTHVWNFDKAQAVNRFKRNHHLVNLLAEKYNFSIIERDIDEFFYNQVDTGRDNTHFGFQTNRNVAESFLTQK